MACSWDLPCLLWHLQLHLCSLLQPRPSHACLCILPTTPPLHLSSSLFSAFYSKLTIAPPPSLARRSSTGVFEHLFGRIAEGGGKYLLECSFLEIYNEVGRAGGSAEATVSTCKGGKGGEMGKGHILTCCRS